MGIGGDCVLYPLVSHAWLCSESVVPLSLQSLCHALSSGANHNSTARRWLLSSPSLAGSHTWCPIPPWFRVIRGWPLYPIQWVESQGWDHLRANLGFGEFWFILPLLVVAYLSPTSFIGMIFSGLSGVGLT